MTRSMNFQRLVFPGLYLYCSLLSYAVGIVITEMGLRQFEPSPSWPLPQKNDTNQSSYMVQVSIRSKDGKEIQTWEFLVHSDMENGRRNVVRFPEFLPASPYNPLVFSASYTQMLSSRMIVTIESHQPVVNSTRYIARFDRELHLPIPFSQQSEAAPLYQLIQSDSGSRLIVFIRWYCASGYSGEYCESHCNEDSCVHEDISNNTRKTEDLQNSVDYLNMPFWVPPLGGADCPCDPCLIVNVASKEQINRTVLQTSLNVLLFLRTALDMHETQSDDWPTAEQPPRAYAQIKLEDVWWSDERRLVAVCVTLDNSHRSTVSIRTIRRVLIDLTVSGWLSTSLDTEKQDGQLVRRPSNDLMQEIVNFVQRYDQVVSNCDAIRSARSSLLTGFWIMLCLAVIMSAVTSYLFYEQYRQKNGHRARKEDRRKVTKMHLLQANLDEVTTQEDQPTADGENPC